MQQQRRPQQGVLSPFSIDPTVQVGEPYGDPSAQEAEPIQAPSPQGAPSFIGPFQQRGTPGTRTQPYLTPLQVRQGPAVHPAFAQGGLWGIGPERLSAPPLQQGPPQMAPSLPGQTRPTGSPAPQLRSLSANRPRLVNPAFSAYPGQLPVGNLSVSQVSTPGTGVQGGPQGPQQPNVRTPPVDIFDEGEEIVMEFELPGISKKEIKLVGRERGLFLEATSDVDLEGKEMIASEAGSRVYQREIPIDVEILPDEIEATFANGILKVTLPKKDPTSGPRTIEIS